MKCTVLVFLSGAALATLSGVASAASAPKARWTTNDEYPAQALAAGHEGTSYFKVTVTVDGRAKDCIITKSSGHSELDQATCSIVLKRARFKPKIGDAGEPVEGTFESKMTWRIPR